jgi:rare lipoprotein A
MKVKVTNLRNGQSVTVRINDRGPWIHGRLIDVSKATAQKLKFLGAGLTQVRIEVLSHPTPQGADASSAPSQEGL